MIGIVFKLNTVDKYKILKVQLLFSGLAVDWIAGKLKQNLTAIKLIFQFIL